VVQPGETTEALSLTGGSGTQDKAAAEKVEVQPTQAAANGTDAQQLVEGGTANNGTAIDTGSTANSNPSAADGTIPLSSSLGSGEGDAISNAGPGGWTDSTSAGGARGPEPLHQKD
jgi:hypothetical protein